ncbi:RcpC/CpaB family pilus assembly protein [Streptomyces sp. NPDC005899]|uniref:RcpC/CpaB family pilus assembly protein n=1 Tax=Streptomyces sp. NPDC005899 TaxID=3155716 RepID=UPI0033CB9596
MAPAVAEAGAGHGVRQAPERQRVRLVSAPVRIADAAAVGLLRPGDRVDVLAAYEGEPKARLVARDVRITRIPRGQDGSGADDSGPDGSGPARADAPYGGADAGSGALVVLAVPRATAAALAGAGVSGTLVVAVSRAA